ncbi:MAG: SUKH-3 domain-containing protein [Anaerolineae bacterium]|jgi:hypothetical protein|nr:SUKH-3 domain-containing protein [Anaerolineae bacterium]
MSEYTVESILRQFGWNRGYKYDVSRFKGIFDGLGCPIHKASQDFLSAYGAISCKSLQGDVFEFDPLSGGDKNWLYINKYICEIYKDLSQLFEGYFDVKQLVPIGTACNQHIELVMSEDGMVLGHYDEAIHFIGNNAAEAIINLYTDKITWLNPE